MEYLDNAIDTELAKTITNVPQIVKEKFIKSGQINQICTEDFEAMSLEQLHSMLQIERDLSEQLS